MADESAEKTEQPTPKKLQDAAEKGQIARSQDMATAFVLIGSATALLIFGKSLAMAVLDVGRRMMMLNQKDIFEPNSMFSAWGAVGERLGVPMAGIFVTFLVAAFLGRLEVAELLVGIGLGFLDLAGADRRLLFCPLVERLACFSR